MTRPLYSEWDEESHNELPERLVRCGCGELVDELDGCSRCDGTDEAELGVAS